MSPSIYDLHPINALASDNDHYLEEAPNPTN
jgi:hypothetical protein